MPNYTPYTYGSVAYKQDAYAPVAPRRQPRQRIDVVPGGAKGRAAQVSPAHALARKVATITVVAALVFCGVGVGRITLSAATVAEALEARTVTNQLDEARSAISELEVMQSSLSNPTRIKAEAAALGMASAAETSVIDLSGDVMVTDGKGNLSLTGSLSVIVEGQKAAAAQAEEARRAAAEQQAADEALAALRAAQTQQSVQAPSASPAGASSL